GGSWMPAPVSSSRSACSATITRKPLRASASAAVRPPMPPPATMTVREGATPASAPDGSGRLPQGAFGRPRRVRIERRIVAEQGRAVRADDLAVVAHVEEHVRMIERRQCADAHELLGADLDHPHVFLDMGDDREIICSY